MENESINKKIAYFVSFCIECYKNKHKMQGGDVFKLFEEKGINDYLARNYEVLHTQGERWLIAEIEEKLKKIQ